MAWKVVLCQHCIIHLRYKLQILEKSIDDIKTWVHYNIIFRPIRYRVRYTVKSAANDNPALDSLRATQYREGRKYVFQLVFSNKGSLLGISFYQ